MFFGLFLSIQIYIYCSSTNFCYFSIISKRADARVNAANQAMEREQERQRHSQNMYFEDARNQHQEQHHQDTQQHHLQNNYRVRKGLQCMTLIYYHCIQNLMQWKIFRLFPTYWITYSSLIMLSRKFVFHTRLHFNPILHNSMQFQCIYDTYDKIQQKEIMYSVSILIGL